MAVIPMASVIGFSCTVHPFPVHIVYPLCIECLLEEYRNKTMHFGEIHLIFTQMFLLFYSFNMGAVNTIYILNSQIERNYMYWLLCFLHTSNVTFLLRKLCQL